MCPARTNLSASHPAGPAPPSRPAVRRPTGPARGVSGFGIRQINRLPTAGQLRALIPQRFTLEFPCLCFRGVVQDICLRCPGGQEGRLCPARTNPSAFHPAGPALPGRPAVRRPTRPARGVSGIWIRQVAHSQSIVAQIVKHISMPKNICRVDNLDIPRTGRVGAHGGAAARGRAGLVTDRTVRPGNKRPSYPPRHRRHVA